MTALAESSAPAIVAADAAEVINVALGIDHAYAPHATAVIASLVANAPGARFRFLILHTRIDASLRKRVEQTAPGAGFFWRELKDNDVPPMADRQHFSRAILFRLGIEKYAPADWKRVLYLDADLIVNADVRALWRADLRGQPIGAVLDCFIDPAAFARRWHLSEAAPAYFNSGVLLIDLDQVRAEFLFSKALEFAAAHHTEIEMVDQDALNAAFWMRWAPLDPIWNAQRHMAIPTLIAETAPDRRLNGRAPAIIHYTGPEKPWLSHGYHPWAWLYWRAIAATPFRNDVARVYRVSAWRRFMLWVRWLRRHP